MKNRSLFKRFKNPLAFTLIEIVVVVALLAVLSAAVVPALSTTYTKQKTAAQLNGYFDTVNKQAQYIVKRFNDSKMNGEAPRLSGYDLSTARGMQECLRSANNNSADYDIELTVINETPDPEMYNYIDTLVVCIQFYDQKGVLMKNGKGVACSPEQAVQPDSVKTCKLVNIWYIKTDQKSGVYKSLK